MYFLWMISTSRRPHWKQESREISSVSLSLCLSPRFLLFSHLVQVLYTCQVFAQAFGEGQCLKAKYEHRRLLFAWAEQELPGLLIWMTNSPSSFFWNLELLWFFWIWCQILISDFCLSPLFKIGLLSNFYYFQYSF